MIFLHLISGPVALVVNLLEYNILGYIRIGMVLKCFKLFTIDSVYGVLYATSSYLNYILPSLAFLLTFLLIQASYQFDFHGI